MRILITGAHGFIGTNLAAELEAAGHEVIGTDWRESPLATRVDVSRDLRQERVFQWIADHAEPEVVIHAAAQVGRLFGEDDLIRTVKSNAQMTTLVANWCGRNGARLVYLSSSEIYGDQGELVCVEGGPVALPHNLYGLSKRWGEEVCQLYAPDELTILRLSMPYGPGVPVGRGRAALPNIVWQAMTGQRIPIHRGAERSWCYISDTTAAIRLTIEDTVGGIFNVGRDDNPIAMLDLAGVICDFVGADRNLIDEIDPPQAQTVVKRLSTDRVRALGWEPQVDLSEGIRLVAEWVRNFDADGNWTGEEVAA